MKIKKINKSIYLFILITGIYISSCSLEEENPSGYTMEIQAASSVEGYMEIINNCYFGWQQRMAGNFYYSIMCEGGTDLWTHQKNNNTQWREWFFYGSGTAWNLDKFKDQWFASYDGIGYCNLAIDLANLPPFKDEAQKNEIIAEAYFLRAYYYTVLVEQFGAVTLILKRTDEADMHPERTDPLTIYKEAIIPDLEFAAQWLPIENGESRPSRKTAIAFLAKAYLQSVEYDQSKSYAGDALAQAEILINDCEAGGNTYRTYMYPTFEEVFDEVNNISSDLNEITNKEALWAHRFVAGGTPRNAQETNETNKLFYCNITDFDAVVKDFLAWGGLSGGRFMPSHYLLKLFIQDDGSLDPRYHKSFQTMWKCNNNYTWSSDDLTLFDRTDAITDTDSLIEGDTAVLLLHPNDENYNSMVASKRDKKYLFVDLADVYNDTVRMKYTRVKDGVTTVNPFISFYPSLSKHNTSHNDVVTEGDKYANRNAIFIMRMAEVYLIAAEAAIYESNPGKALTFINKIRERAGATPLTGTPTIQTVLDERARELCGEFIRFTDLKRTGMLTRNYLMEKNLDVGQFFDDNIHTLRPIPNEFLETIEESGEYYQNPGY